MNIRALSAGGLLLASAAIPAPLQAEGFPVSPGDLYGWAAQQCGVKQQWPPEIPAPWQHRSVEREAVQRRGIELGERVLVALPGGESIRLDHIEPPGRPGRWILETRAVDGRPLLFVGLDDSCGLREIRRLRYRDGSAMEIERLDGAFQVIETQPLDPPVPDRLPESPDTNVIPVGLVDSGVNYLLPEILQGIAVNGDGRLLGYDFWDMDERPFDANPAASPFFVQRHGTRTASLLLAEAPQVRIVSYRYPRPEMGRMADLVDHAAHLGLRIVALPLGSNQLSDWQAFEQAAREQPQILFIASAGNDGRDIDQTPVYPAALDLPNMLVVSSSDDFLRPARGSNSGAESVDYLLPAEGLMVTRFNGRQRRVSGSSYAVSRMAALAARLLAAQPSMDTGALRVAIDRLAVRQPDGAYSRLGVIPDPLADTAQVEWRDAMDEYTDYADAVSGPKETGGDRVALDIRVLDERWRIDAIGPAMAAAATILGQCHIALDVTSLHRFQGSDYLKNLDSGSAYTLFGSAGAREDRTIRIVLARDSRMQMQFDAEAFAPGNTSTRPWLRNSVWVMHGASDLAETLAHELFHVLANDGTHAPGPGNLMHESTEPGQTNLTGAQCALARRFFHRG